MTTRQAGSAKPLLAPKGLAVPAGLPNPDDASPRPRDGSAREVSTGGVRAAKPETAPASLASPEAASTRGAEIAPAASLLSFDFLGAEGAALDPARPSGRGPGETPAPSAGSLLGAAHSCEPEPAPAQADAPRADPTWRITRDRTPAKPRTGRVLPALVLLLVLAAALGAGWYAHKTGRLDFKMLVTEIANRPTAELAEITPAEVPAAPEGSIDPAEAPAAPEDRIESAAAPSGVRGLGAPEPTQPSVDVVRIEPDGAAVLAGRAAPGAELVLFDNGTPIGMITADALGEWVFLPTSPLPAGAHQFDLVVRSVQGRVTLPAAETGRSGIEDPALKDAERGPAGSAPKPEAQAPAPPGPGFAIQLASAKTRAGAQGQLLELRQRFPELLADMQFSLDETRLAIGVTIVRLRAGVFAERREAAALCERLEAKRQDCLVVPATAGQGGAAGAP